ncbi:MAG: M18 family aminopeptidase [Tissierellia bacterium]|nr:M18 family aminopeptidase [Tissierellia bacterium]
MKKFDLIDDFLKFIDKSPVSYQAVDNLSQKLIDSGFEKLDKGEKWNLRHSGKYFIINNDSSIIAFRIGKINSDFKFHIIGSHSDSPGFRVKPKSIMEVDRNYIKLNTEVYGGPILSTWFDRPLSLAGRVLIKGDQKPITRLINIDRDLLIIPNLAIHMNREVNNGYTFNAQKDTLPLLSLMQEEADENFLHRLISEEIKIDQDQILDFDLYLYVREKASILGYNSEFISAGRLDNLAMAHSSINALIDSGESESTNIVIVTDNEEVGSMSRQGADSPMIRDTLERISICINGEREDFYRAISKSFMISADMAHALHPNYAEKADPTNYPIINKGPVIKLAASKAYTSDGYSSAVYKQLCDNAGVPCQEFTNRSDLRGGSTIGPITSKHLDIAAVDIGNPMLAMHSVRELGGVDDHYYIYKSFIEFFK